MKKNVLGLTLLLSLAPMINGMHKADIKNNNNCIDQEGKKEGALEPTLSYLLKKNHYDLLTPQELAFLKNKNFSAIQRFISTTILPRLSLYQEILNKIPVNHTELKDYIGSLTSSVFSPDGKYILNGYDDCRVRLLDAESGECIHIFEGYTGVINSVAFSNDGKWILTGSEDKMACLWDMKTKECIHIFEGHTNVMSVVFKTDDKIITGYADKSACLWDLSQFKVIKKNMDKQISLSQLYLLLLIEDAIKGNSKVTLNSKDLVAYNSFDDAIKEVLKPYVVEKTENNCTIF